VVGVVLAVAFALTKGFHDAANSIAPLVATRWSVGWSEPL
jgi:phosphate/sulfate permease